jgi:hypothetical protein
MAVTVTWPMFYRSLLLLLLLRCGDLVMVSH